MQALPGMKRGKPRRGDGMYSRRRRTGANGPAAARDRMQARRASERLMPMLRKKNTHKICNSLNHGITLEHFGECQPFPILKACLRHLSANVLAMTTCASSRQSQARLVLKCLFIWEDMLVSVCQNAFSATVINTVNHTYLSLNSRKYHHLNDKIINILSFLAGTDAHTGCVSTSTPADSRNLRRIYST